MIQKKKIFQYFRVYMIMDENGIVKLKFLNFESVKPLDSPTPSTYICR